MISTERSWTLTCVFLHQSAVHISSNILFVPFSSANTRSGTSDIKFLKAGFPMSSFTHSTGSRIQSSKSSDMVSPPSPTRSPSTFTITQLQLGPVGSRSTFFKKEYVLWKERLPSFLTYRSIRLNRTTKLEKENIKYLPLVGLSIVP